MDRSVEEWAQSLRQLKPEALMRLVDAIALVSQENQTPPNSPPASSSATDAVPHQDLDNAMEEEVEENASSSAGSSQEELESFQEVKKKRRQKRKRQADPISPIPEVSEITNKKSHRSNWRPFTATEPTPRPSEPQEVTPSEPSQETPASVQPKKPKIPPIIVRDAGKWTQISAKMASERIHFTKAKPCADGIRVQMSSTDAFRAATRLLERYKVPFHTFTLEEDRPIRVVLRRVPIEIPVDEVAEDLKAQGFHPVGVSRMKRLITKKELPLVLVEVPHDEKKIFDLKTICFLTINVEKPRKSGLATQCHNCQWFHHTQRNCRVPPKCVKCGKDHASRDCQKTRESPATCANCGQSHTASYRGCAKFPGMKTHSQKPQPQVRPTPPKSVPEKTAPKPAPPSQRVNIEHQGQTKTEPKGKSTQKSFAEATSTQKTNDLNSVLVSMVTAIGNAKNGTEAIQRFVTFIPKLTSALTKN
jgi:hypothetical protein